jgi:sugar transferase (PEP-CTERM/EpsH1 system associated)
MGEILFLAHRIPFPPDRGDKIRSHHILKRLAELAPIHVATFADDEYDFAAEPELAALAASYKLVRRAKPLPLAGVEALVSGAPVSVTAFHSRALSAYVAELLATRPISAIYVFSGQMGQYVPASYRRRVVADFVDVDSAKFEAYGAKKSGLRSWIDAREGKVLRAEEARLAARADVSLLISDAEAALFRERLPAAQQDATRIEALANGIDSGSFNPAAAEPEPALEAFAAPRLIFTGQMDYAPNIEAVERAITAILPRVRKVHPETSFHVVGRNPPQALLDRHGKDGAYVWGRVPDMTAWLRAADMALVPLTIGRGVQNKVLEAMAMELPVVLSPEAATGIPASDGIDFAVGRSDEALAAAVIALASDAEKARAMGTAARRFVVENASWEAALANLPAIVFPEGGAARDAA